VYADFTLQQRLDAWDKFVAAYGQGRVYVDVLKTLIEKTRRLQRESNVDCVIWAIHFAPFACGYGLCLIDHEDLVNSAEELGVNAILCGHTHDAHVEARKGFNIYCSGAAGSIDREEKALLHVFNIDIDGSCSLWRENYRWNPAESAFVSAGRD
jgi:hypothetical protein